MPSLPIELFEEILSTVWWTAEPPSTLGYVAITPAYQRYRAQLFQEFALVCKTWHTAMHAIAFRMVIIHTIGDIDFYGQLVRRSLAPLMSPNYENFDDTHEAHRRLFSSSHLVLRHHSALQSLTHNGIMSRNGFLIPCIPDACVADIYCDKYNVSMSTTVTTWQQWLHQTKYTTRVTVIVTTGIRQSISRSSPALHPAVKELHCLGRSVLNQNDFRDSTMAKALQGSPSLTHLALDSGLSLKYIIPPTTHPNLWCITLKCPPQNGVSYLQSWCIRSALVSGLLRRGRGTATTSERRLVIHASQTIEPMGWQSALMACQEHGVKLLHVVTY